nr:galactinol--sucrose galactosyltransferase [Quercus suber]
MGAFVRDLKGEFKSVDSVYVWHALCGYWGGVRPSVPGLPESVVVEPKLSLGLKLTMEDLAVDKIVDTGVGLVLPEIVDQMYEGLHSHLEAVGIDGVKVDVIHLLEMVCENYGGRVELAKAYYKALTASVKKHFNGNGVIASREHCNDFMFLGTEAICLGRVGCDMVHCAYNSLWMGNFIQLDWDMFQSTHPCTAFHAASRAISGGPIYYTGVLGAFNCQGGGWSRETRSKQCFSQCSNVLTSQANPKDIEWKRGKNPISIEGVHVFALYYNQDKKLVLSKPSENVELSLEPFKFELITVSPVTVLAGTSFEFAPIGLVNMLNTGGAIQSLAFNDDGKSVQIRVKGTGEMRGFASEKPIACKIDEEVVPFEYEGCMVVIQVPWPDSSKSSIVEYIF